MSSESEEEQNPYPRGSFEAYNWGQHQQQKWDPNWVPASQPRDEFEWDMVRDINRDAQERVDARAARRRARRQAMDAERQAAEARRQEQEARQQRVLARVEEENRLREQAARERALLGLAAARARASPLTSLSGCRPMNRAQGGPEDEEEEEEEPRRVLRSSRRRVPRGITPSRIMDLTADDIEDDDDDDFLSRAPNLGGRPSSSSSSSTSSSVQRPPEASRFILPGSDARRRPREEDGQGQGVTRRARLDQINRPADTDQENHEALMAALRNRYAVRFRYRDGQVRTVYPVTYGTKDGRGKVLVLKKNPETGNMEWRSYFTAQMEGVSVDRTEPRLSRGNLNTTSRPATAVDRNQPFMTVTEFPPAEFDF